MTSSQIITMALSVIPFLSLFAFWRFKTRWSDWKIAWVSNLILPGVVLAMCTFVATAQTLGAQCDYGPCGIALADVALVVSVVEAFSLILTFFFWVVIKLVRRRQRATDDLKWTFK